MKTLPDQSGKFGRRFALAVTNAIKVSGLALALHEVFGRSSPRTVELLVAAFMMTGAQISEEVVLGIASRFFGLHHQGAEKDEHVE